MHRWGWLIRKEELEAGQVDWLFAQHPSTRPHAVCPRFDPGSSTLVFWSDEDTGLKTKGMSDLRASASMHDKHPLAILHQRIIP